jgi:hypothetical protein
MPAGAMLIGLVTATALIPASTQALSWSVVPTPNVKPGTHNNEFNAVSCASATSCVAVGDEEPATKRQIPFTALIRTPRRRLAPGRRAR